MRESGGTHMSFPTDRRTSPCEPHVTPAIYFAFGFLFLWDRSVLFGGERRPDPNSSGLERVGRWPAILQTCPGTLTFFE